MGLERLVSVLQDKHSNYDTDVFVPLLEKLHELAPNGTPKYQGKTYDDDVGGVDTAYRIIVDHIRTTCICLSDDIVPGKFFKT